jgi:phage gp46-like protein
MTTDRYDNDPAIIITNDGGTLDYSGGQPLMDEGGLENAAIISLFTLEGWPGNALETDPDRMIGSDFYTHLNGAPITSDTIRAMDKSAERALDWMVNIGLAKEVKATVSMLSPKRLSVFIEIVQVSGISIYFKYDLNWTASVNLPVINKGVN